MNRHVSSILIALFTGAAIIGGIVWWSSGSISAHLDAVQNADDQVWILPEGETNAGKACVTRLGWLKSTDTDGLVEVRHDYRADNSLCANGTRGKMLS